MKEYIKCEMRLVCMFTVLGVHCISTAALMMVMQPELHKCCLVDRTSTGNYGPMTLQVQSGK
jgi:hypothetical protein